jgi:hypothetical protein
MTTELFEGNPEALQARLVALLAGPATTINFVLLTHSKGKYIIAYT